jgi:hypothetical protein
VNCVLRNCQSENNAGHAYHIYLGQMNEQSPPISIRFENCTSKGCQRYSTYVGVANRNGDRTVHGTIEYVDCRFEQDAGAGIYIRGNEADGCEIRFERCEIVRHDEKVSRLAPITIEAPRRPDLDVGNIEINNCTIRDTLVRKPLALIASPMTRVRNLTGSLTVNSPNGENSYTLDAAQLNEWFPSQGLVARIPRFTFDWKKTSLAGTDVSAADKGTNFRLRGEAEWLVWGKADRPIELVARLEPVGQHKPSVGVMNLTTPAGVETKLNPKVEDKQFSFSFMPRVTGPHRLHWQGDSKTTIRPIRCSAAAAILGESLGVNLIRPVGTLYFLVPVAVKRFALQITGQGTAETVKAIVRDASGRIVDQEDNINTPHVFILTRNAVAQRAIWSVTFDRASKGVLEDVSIQTLGVPPVFGTTPGEVFVPLFPR